MSIMREVESEVKEHASQSIFGSFDGMTSVLGVLAGLATRPTHVIVGAALGLAVASAVGMGAGQYLGDDKRELHVAVIMAAATLIGTLLPIVPFVFLSGTPALICAGVIAIGITCVIAWRRKSWAQTFAVLALVAVATLAVGLLTAGGGS